MKTHNIYLDLVKFFVIAALIIHQSFCGIVVYSAANTYYVDIENGSDSNNGLSEQNAWKTVQNVKSKTFISGDTILFHRGQKWYQAGFTPNCSTIAYGAYGEGERPILSGATIVSGWQLYQGTVYSITAPVQETAYLMKIGGELIKRDQVESVSVLPENKFMQIDNKIYFNSPFGNPDVAAKVTEVQISHNMFSINALKNITIKDLNLTMTGGALIDIQSADSSNITVSNNELSFGESAYLTAGAGINCSGTKSSLFTGNIIHDAFGDGIILWNCSGVTVSNNHITKVMKGVNPGGDGIQSSGKLANSAPNNKILNNYVSMEGSDTPKGCIQQENGDNVVISGNTCLYGFFGVESNSNYGLVENNYCAYQGVVPSPVNWSAGLYMSEDLDIVGMTWRNNVVYNAKPIGFHINHPQKRSQFKIYNNTIYNSGSAFRCTSPLSGEIKNNIFWNDKAGSAPFSISSVVPGESIQSDYNILGPQTEGKFISYLGNSYDTIWMFRNVTGNDIHSKVTRPLFVDAPQKDFRLYSNSSGVDVGINVGTTKDFEGMSVPQNNGYNMGAVESIVLVDEEPVEEPTEPNHPVPEYYQDGLLVYESFDYSPTESLNGLGSSNFGWNGNWTESSLGVYPGKIGTAGMYYNGIYDKGYKALFTSGFSRKFEKPIGEQTGTYWVSFLAKNNNAGRELTVGLYAQDGSNITMKQRNTDPWKISINSTGKGAYNIINLIVLKVTVTSTKTTANMWVNPSLANGEAGLGTANASYSISKQALFSTFSMGMSTGTAVYAEIDEIRIGTNFTAAVMQQLVQQSNLKANKVRLMANGEQLPETINEMPQEVVGKATVFNAVSLANSKKANYVIAVYKDGQLKRLKSKVDEIALGEMKNIEVTLDGLGDLEQGDYTIKLMMWDNEQIIPMSDNYIVNVVKPVEAI